MISIGIDPILISVGAFSVSWHGLFMVTGIAVGVFFSARLMAKAGLSRDTFYSLAPWAILGGIIGARLLHLVDHWEFYLANPELILAVWRGGLAVWGGILGGTIAALIFAKIQDKGFYLAPYADQIAPGLILAQATGRIGCIIDGDVFSTTTGLPWGVVYTHSHSPSYGRSPQHPAVGYELLMDLFIFGILWKLRGRLKPDGSLFLLYTILYSVGRFFLSFLRLDSNTVLLSLNQAQWVALLTLAVAIPLLVFRRVSYQKQSELSTADV